MSSQPFPLTSVFAPARHLPPLENGDRLTSREFERRYNAMPELKKAELIEGIVYMASPLRFQPHAQPHGRLITGLIYVFPGLWLNAPAMLQGDLQRVLLSLRSGINSPEHQAFVQQLIAGQQQHGKKL